MRYRRARFRTRSYPPGLKRDDPGLGQVLVSALVEHAAAFLHRLAECFEQRAKDR